MIKVTDVGTMETEEDIDYLLPSKGLAQHQEERLVQQNESQEMEISEAEEGVDSQIEVDRLRHC